MLLHRIVLVLTFVIGGTSNLLSTYHFQLINDEAKFINVLTKFTEGENARLEKLQKFEDLLSQNIQLYATVDELAWNPLAIYKTIKHLTVDLQNAKENMETNSHHDIVLEALPKENLNLLNEDHLYHEIHDLTRSFRMYNLSVADIMDGQAFPTVNGSITAEDCFLIGKMSAEKHDHETAVSWLDGCVDRLDSTLRGQALKILLPSYLLLGNKSQARNATTELLKKYYEHNRALLSLKVKLGLELGHEQSQRESDTWETSKACAGDYDNELAHQKDLKCRYVHWNSPFLTIAPLKEEIVSLNPVVSIIREAVYDSEIEFLKFDASSKYRNSYVSSPGTQPYVNTEIRLAQSAWLDSMLPEYDNLRDRLQDISSLIDAGDFKMVGYAPGGYYRAHSDFIVDPRVIKTHGNSIATALMYMNELPLGGETVFPRLKLKIRPEKGSLVFWLNMRADGSEEDLAYHASCPVAYGEKIVLVQAYLIRYQYHWL